MHAIEHDENTGTDFFVAGRETAWHRLGDFQADRLLTVQEAGERAHLYGWDQRLVPAGALVDPEDPLSWSPIEGRRYVVRNHPLTGAPETFHSEQVGERFQVFQNEQTAEFAQEVAGVFGDEEIVSAAGSIYGGARVFFTLSLEGFTTLGDRHDQWLTVMNGNDGLTNLTGWTGAVRAVCANTIDWGLETTTNRVKVRHSGDMPEKAKQAASLLGVARDWAKAYDEAMEVLASRKMTDNAFQKMVTKAWDLEVKPEDGVRTKNRKVRDLEVLMFTYTKSPTTETGRGTRYAALQAMTEWAEWGRPGDLNTEKAATINMLGTPATMRAKAYALAMAK